MMIKDSLLKDYFERLVHIQRSLGQRVVAFVYEVFIRSIQNATVRKKDCYIVFDINMKDVRQDEI